MNVRCRIVGLPIWLVRSVVEVKCYIEIVNYLQVAQYRDVETVSFKHLYEIFFDSFLILSASGPLTFLKTASPSSR